jgi:hypothetical protein
MFAVTMLCLLHVMALPLPNDDDDMIEWWEDDESYHTLRGGECYLYKSRPLSGCKAWYSGQNVFSLFKNYCVWHWSTCFIPSIFCWPHCCVTLVHQYYYA